jgi:hypothetical protein
MDIDDFGFVPVQPSVESLLSKEYQLYETPKFSSRTDQRAQTKRIYLLSDDEEPTRTKISSSDDRARVGMQSKIDGYHSQAKRGLLLSNNDSVSKKNFLSNIAEDRLMRVRFVSCIVYNQCTIVNH